jgi:hypothetical protein
MRYLLDGMPLNTFGEEIFEDLLFVKKACLFFRICGIAKVEDPINNGQGGKPACGK